MCQSFYQMKNFLNQCLIKKQKYRRLHMDEIIRIENSIDITSRESELVELTEGLLIEARAAINNNNVLCVPIGKLSALGSGISSLMPQFNTITHTTTMNTNGLYRIANAAAGDTLKIARNGNAWGAMKTALGGSKMAQLKEVGSISSTTQSVAAFNPETIMMAVALYSIEKELAEIAEMQKKILRFLEIESESQIEADVESMMGIISNYKYNWDNKLSVANNHNLVIDIQNRARKNMIAYQKKVMDIISSKKFVVAQKKINSTFVELEKKFNYYRLSLYIFSMASFMEIMLSENFKEEYITNVKEEVKILSATYREQFRRASIYLEGLGNVSVEAKVVKSIGTAGRAVGKLMGNTPVIKESPVDEFLQDKGASLEKNGIEMKRAAVKRFAAVGNPRTRVFVEKMEDMIQIYNHTSQICFDNENIYLLRENK